MNKRVSFFTAAICVLPLIFSGCSGDFFNNEYVDIVITGSEGRETAPVQTIGYDVEISAAEESTAFEEAVENFPIDTILLPDGSSIDKHKADRVIVDKNGEIKLEFDFWFMRYAKPFFQSNIDGFGEYRESWDGFETGLEEALDLKYEDFFKVERGTVLENGMTVSSAGFTVNEEGWYRDEYVSCWTDATYEGVILCCEGYTPVNETDDIVFLPDPTKDMAIPIIYHGDYDDVKKGRGRSGVGSYRLPQDTFAVLDGSEFTLGNKGELAYKFGLNFDNVFIEDPESVCSYSYAKAKVKVTVNSLYFNDDYVKARVSEMEFCD